MDLRSTVSAATIGGPGDANSQLRLLLGRAPRICIMALSNIPNDPRVRRQGDTFHDAGWNVVALGLPGSHSTLPDWRVLTTSDLAGIASEAQAGVATDIPVAIAREIQEQQFRFVIARKLILLTPTVVSGLVQAWKHLASRDGYIRYADIVHATGVACSPVSKLLREPLTLDVAHRISRRRFEDFIRSLTNKTKANRPAYKIASLVVTVAVLAMRCLVKAAYRLKSLMARLRALAKRSAVLVNPASAPSAYLQVPEINVFYRLGHQVDADIYLANDWHMLPVAMRLAADRGTYYCYDFHEHALEEYRYREKWYSLSAFLKRVLIREIESRGIAQALVASTVSQGIADDVAREYKLGRQIMEIRNVPNHVDLPEKKVRGVFDVLYHGLIVPDRGIEESVRSVALWRPEFRFVLRGPGPDDYITHLKNVAQQTGVSGRVIFAPPVPMTELVRAAAAADIGLSTPPRTSKHNIYALPNKFFEYIQAGLAICVPDLPDMGRIVRQYDLGVLIGEVSPAAIADGINRLDTISVARYAANSRQAAKSLNWQSERAKLLESYSSALLCRHRG